MAKAKLAAAGSNQCRYECIGEQWKLVENNAPIGFVCLPTLGGTCTNGSFTSTPAVPIPDEPLALVANSAEYVYSKSSKSLHFKSGTCSKGKHFPSVISVKDLAKIEADAAELVKSMQKNKRIASFSVVLKAQKVEKA